VVRGGVGVNICARHSVSITDEDFHLFWPRECTGDYKVVELPLSFSHRRGKAPPHAWIKRIPNVIGQVNAKDGNREVVGGRKEGGKMFGVEKNGGGVTEG